MTQAETDQQHADADAQKLNDANAKILIEIASLKALHPNIDFGALDAAVGGVAADVNPVVPVVPPVAKPLYEFTGTGAVDATVWTVASVKAADGTALYTFNADVAGGQPTGADPTWVVYTGKTA